MVALDLAGQSYLLDPAAISAVRYRAKYGRSIVAGLAACRSRREEEAVLLRLCHVMIPPKHRPPLLDFARAARRDGAFPQKARAARDALLAGDGPLPPAGEGPPFDEYRVLALMALAGVDMGLLYELPLLHLVGVLRRCGELRDPACKDYRPMTSAELARLYPRRAS